MLDMNRPIRDILKDVYFDYWHQVGNAATGMVETFHKWCEANPGQPTVDQSVVDGELAKYKVIEDHANAVLKERLEALVKRIPV